MTEYEEHIEDHGDGTYTLYVGSSPVAKIDWWNKTNVRVCRWMIHGPADLNHSIAMMRGFLHLTALLGNEKQGIVRPPEFEEPVTEKLEKQNGKYQKRPRSASLVGKSSRKSRQGPS